jgi:hypothetical protein
MTDSIKLKKQRKKTAKAMYFKRNVKDDGSHGDDNGRPKLYLTYCAGGHAIGDLS